MPTFTSRAPSESAYIDQSAPTSNFNSGTLYVGDGASTAAARSLIQYDLSSIPSSAIVTSASLALTFFQDISSNARTLSAYRVLRNWVHTQVTWNVYATASNWGTAGCSNTTTDRESGTIGSVAVAATPTAGTVYTINLTAALVQEWLSGVLTNNGLLLQVDTETSDQLGYYGIDAAEGNRPLLTIAYTVISGTSTISGTGVATGASLLVNKVFTLPTPKTSFTIDGYR